MTKTTKKEGKITTKEYYDDLNKVFPCFISKDMSLIWRDERIHQKILDEKITFNNKQVLKQLDLLIDDLENRKHSACKEIKNCYKCSYYQGFDKEYHCSLIKNIDIIKQKYQLIKENQNL